MSSPRLLDQLHTAARTRHLSPLTEKAYAHWVRRFVIYHGKKHPKKLGAPEIRQFLGHLATHEHVAASTQNQALSGLLFLYRSVLQIELEPLGQVVRARRPARVPVVFTRSEALAVLGRLEGQPALVASLLYGSGLRLKESLELRVKDLDFGRQEIVVRRGKGGRDRTTMLPGRICEPLQLHLEAVRATHSQDLALGHGWTDLPFALGRKYPNAGREWKWQYLFPATTRVLEPSTGRLLRYHLHPSAVQKAVRRAIRAEGIQKLASCHTFRHSFATQLLEAG